MVSFDADSCLSSGHAAWLNSWVMGRVHQSMRRRGSLWRPRILRVHVSTTGGITTSGKPLAMYGADDPPYGKSRVNCQVPRPACPSPPTARLTRRLEPPPSCRSVADALYKSDPNKTVQLRRLPLSNWRRKPLAYHPPLPQSASCVSPRFRQRHKLLNLLQVLDMAPIVFVGLRF
jgi:hypothetical protein